MKVPHASTVGRCPISWTILLALRPTILWSKPQHRLQKPGHVSHFDFPNKPPSKEACVQIAESANDPFTLKALEKPGVKCCGGDEDIVKYELPANVMHKEISVEDIVRIPPGVVNLKITIDGGISDIDMYILDKTVFPNVYVVHWKEGVLHDRANRYMRNPDGSYDLKLRGQRLAGNYEGMEVKYFGDDKTPPIHEVVEFRGATNRELYVQVHNHEVKPSPIEISYKYDGIAPCVNWTAPVLEDKKLWADLMAWSKLNIAAELPKAKFLKSLFDTLDTNSGVTPGQFSTLDTNGDGKFTMEEKLGLFNEVDTNHDGMLSAAEFKKAQQLGLTERGMYKLSHIVRYCETNPCAADRVDKDDRNLFTEDFNLQQIDPIKDGCTVNSQQENSSVMKHWAVECPGQDEGKEVYLQPTFPEGQSLAKSELWQVLCDEDDCRCTVVDLGKPSHFVMHANTNRCMGYALAPEKCQDCSESRSQQHGDHVHSKNPKSNDAHIHAGCPEALLDGLARQIISSDHCTDRGFKASQSLHQQDWPIVWVNIHRSELLAAAAVSAVSDIFGPIGILTALASAGTLQALSKYMAFLMLLTQFNGQLGLPDKFTRFADSFTDIHALLSFKELFSIKGLKRFLKKIQPVFDFLDFSYLIPLSSYVAPFLAPIIKDFLDKLDMGECANHTDQFMDAFFDPSTQGLKAFEGSDEQELIKKKKLAEGLHQRHEKSE